MLAALANLGIQGVEIIGSLENIGKVIDERRVSEVMPEYKTHLTWLKKNGRALI